MRGQRNKQKQPGTYRYFDPLASPAANANLWKLYWLGVSRNASSCRDTACQAASLSPLPVPASTVTATVTASNDNTKNFVIVTNSVGHAPLHSTSLSLPINRATKLVVQFRNCCCKYAEYPPFEWCVSLSTHARARARANDVQQRWIGRLRDPRQRTIERTVFVARVFVPC